MVAVIFVFIKNWFHEHYIIMQSQFFFIDNKNHKNQIWFLHRNEKKHIYDATFKLIRFLILLEIASYFSGASNTKYLVSSSVQLNPSILSNLIRKDFVSIKVLYVKCHKSKYFRVVFCLLKYYQKQYPLI